MKTLCFLICFAISFAFASAAEKATDKVTVMDPFVVKADWFKIDYETTLLKDARSGKPEVVVRTATITKLNPACALYKAGIRNGASIVWIQDIAVPGHSKAEIFSKIADQLGGSAEVKIGVWAKSGLSARGMKVQTFTVPIEQKKLQRELVASAQ
jgi:hypothetical protein